MHYVPPSTEPGKHLYKMSKVEILKPAFLHIPASYVVACAVMLHVLDLLFFVTITENSYIVFGLRPVAV